MRETSIPTPVKLGAVEGENGIIVDLTADDVRDLNDGASITTLTPGGEEIAVYPCAAESQPRTATSDVLEAIETIVEYNWEAESDDWEQLVEHGEDNDGHIFHRLRRVRDWLGGMMPKIDSGVTRYDTPEAAERAARKLAERTGHSHSVVSVGGRPKKHNRAAKAPTFLVKRA